MKGYKDIKKFTTLNIAGAESIPTARAFKNYLEEDVLDILQFDIATSGFTEGRRICDLAYIHNKPVAIHSWGSAISIMAGIHFGLTVPNVAFTEYCFMDHPINKELFENKKINFQMDILQSLIVMVWVLNLMTCYQKNFRIKKK